MYQYFDPDKNIMIVYLSLPAGVNEAVCPNPDGSYTVFISSQICEAKQKEAYLHALYHIQHDDFWKPDVQQIEAEAHAHTDRR